MKSISDKIYNKIILNIINRVISVSHSGTRIKLSAPGGVVASRARRFSTKEPATLKWIDGFEKGSVFFDIGANVGIFTLYAALARQCRVFSFEPSVFNLEWLARNIWLNEVSDLVTIFPVPLSDKSGFNSLNMRSMKWGGANSSFGVDYAQDGSKLKKRFRYSTVGLSMDEALAIFDIPAPDYIKMDVDGIEHLILKGGEKTLQGAKSVLIEINEAFEKQRVDSEKRLTEAGFVFQEKHPTTWKEDTTAFNQIWVKPG